ncbi:hypothetical protein JQX13_47285 [Archangium violaceum]|uniref:hypothetical protein n=1 Tax=Archangium violaceum TaxID=83451 RepID=UPI00193C1551|nr:hypothetical protein [Archangium violaceum]QRK07529.1 hypothetical protein JQX13_47285 [Archangium violaceum]
MSTTPFDPVSLQPGDEVAGWRVLRRWRQDSFSITWAVERGGQRRLLRIALHPPSAPDGPFMERFLEREAGALRLVRHPCIIRLHSDGRWPEPVHGFRYLLLDYVEDTTLRDAKKRGLTPKQTVAIFSKLSQIIGAMRRVQLNHGSIQSDTILLRADGQPLLVDFSRADWPGNPYPPDTLTVGHLGHIDDILGKIGGDPGVPGPGDPGKQSPN